MKEVTYEDWQKNPTPRMMWVWDEDEELKEKRKVVYILKTDACICPVLSIKKGDVGYETFCHCAEIEKQRRMTNKELSRWLREKPTRECKQINDGLIYSSYNYVESCEDEEVDEGVMVRENDSEWREPLVEDETCKDTKESSFFWW